MIFKNKKNGKKIENSSFFSKSSKAIYILDFVSDYNLKQIATNISKQMQNSHPPDEGRTQKYVN